MWFRRVLYVVALAVAGWTAGEACAATATQILAPNGTNFWLVFAPGTDGSISGVQFVTVDAAFQPVAGQAMTVSPVTGCNGSFSGAQQLSLLSDSSGVVTLPPWRVLTDYTSGDCQYQAWVPGSATGLVFHYRCCIWNDAFPPAAPAAISVINHAASFTVLTGGAVALRLSLANATAPVHGGPIRVISSTPGCGSFAGNPEAYVVTDFNGMATIPTWTPSVVTDASCVLTATSPYAPALLTIPVEVRTVITTLTGTSPSGGSLTLSLSPASSAASTCSFTSDTTFLNPAALEFFNYPKNVGIPDGMVAFHTQGCGVGAPVTFTVEFPRPLPPTAQWWKYGATPGDPSPHWSAIPATIDGNRITFGITDGDRGDDDLLANGTISFFGALVVPGGVYQDLWWAGSLENGWGMSIVQHRDTLFANLYVYDSAGNPVWYVMPSGAWNSAHTAFTGALYLPNGSPFYAYDGTRFNIGASVGTITITFSDVNTAVMDYTIGGVHGTKNITRVLFGPPTPPTDTPHADLWWAGSAQNGWGLTVMQQYSTIFALWFTYDANGRPVWYVMPDGYWFVRDDWRGFVYSASGPPWLGVTYDASRHHLNNVGTFELQFSGSDTATFTYSVEGKSGTIPLTRIPF